LYQEAWLICSCDAGVYGLREGHFFCRHCDLPCLATAPCETCLGYNMTVDDRFENEVNDQGLEE
jgi:hypothetical protein